MRFKANLNGRVYPFIEVEAPKEIPVFNHAVPERMIGKITPYAARSCATEIAAIGETPVEIEQVKSMPYIVELAGHIEKFHWRSQRIWFKPRTWTNKPLKIIDKFDVTSANISRAE